MYIGIFTQIYFVTGFGKYIKSLADKRGESPEKYLFSPVKNAKISSLECNLSSNLTKWVGRFRLTQVVFVHIIATNRLQS